MRPFTQQGAKYRVLLLQGLGFGDEGKGASIDYLKRCYPEIHTVVRFNGGAQAAHNVVTPEGLHHTFAQFGSATLAGAETFLSRYMLVNPISFVIEATSLAKKIKGFVPKVVVDGEALVTTPFQIAANRIRENLRGEKRHGSCGMGIGETAKDAIVLRNQAIRVADLKNQKVLRYKLSFLQQWKRSQIETLAGASACKEFSWFRDSTEWIEKYLRTFLDCVQVVEGRSYLRTLLQKESVLFEGAQGVLLDQDAGFYPHTTWSNTTFENARQLLREVEYEGPIRHIGVLRAGHTRHGVGPFPTETQETTLLVGEHNQQHDFQGNFRAGYFDGPLARYAARVIRESGALDELFITCLDRRFTELKRAITYQEGSDWLVRVRNGESEQEWLKIQEVRGKQLSNAIPVYQEYKDVESLLRAIESDVDAPVTVTSWGPTASDRRIR